MFKSIELFKEYYQKSKVFLYPALHISRVLLQPEQTYISCTNCIAPTDRKLIVRFKNSNARQFKRFEVDILMCHKMFAGSLPSGDNTVYLFDFGNKKQDWDNFLNGRYSLLSSQLKTDIRSYYGTTSTEYAYLHSYLYPQEYYSSYADMLSVNSKVLEEVGELTDPYDPVKEDLLIFGETYHQIRLQNQSRQPGMLISNKAI